MEYKSKTALITGASSGIGLEYAREFARRGSNLILVARRQDALENLKHELSGAFGVAVTVIAMDLSSADAGQKLVGELAEQVSVAVASGISRERIIVDPGLGFAKDMEQNWALVARLDELTQLGLPILVGASRKRFIAHALDRENPQGVNHSRRDVASAVLTALLLQRKLWGVRVHNVQATVDAISVVSALKEAEK